jgi:hypothetical protein
MTVSPGLTYALGRVGIFLACAIPAMLLLPHDMFPLLKLMIALVVSAVISYFALRRQRDRVAETMAEHARRRGEEREKLRSALAGEDQDEDDGPRT